MIALASPPARSVRYFAMRTRSSPVPLCVARNTVNARQFRGVPPGEALLFSVSVRSCSDGDWLLLLCVKIRKGGFHLDGSKLQVYPRSNMLSALVLHEIGLDTYRRLWRLWRE